MKTFINQATGYYYENDKKITVTSNKVISILYEECECNCTCCDEIEIIIYID